MLFNHLKYLKPIWYYNLKPQKDFGYFPTIAQLDAHQFSYQIDENYQSETAQARDVAWTAFQQGVILKNENTGLNIWENLKLPLHDEYVFLNKNFHKAWVFYVLIIRLFSFHNPIKEVLAYLKTRHIKRFDYSKNHIQHTTYDTFDSKLLKQKPFVSVIIPTLNRYPYLKDVLRDLENQTYKHFEVIIVDQTDDFQEEFYKDWYLDLMFWFQPEKALWKARNEAIKKAKGDYILMSEDDIRFHSNFIEQHLKTIDFFNCQISSGVFFPSHSKIPKERSYFKFAEQFATGNAMFNKNIIEKIGIFDVKFEKQRMGDGEYGLRAYLAGIKAISNPHAYCLDVKAPSGGLRQMGSWDSWRPKKLFGPRPVPSVLYFSRKYFGYQLSILYILNTISPSLIPYKYKRNKFLKFLSFLILPFVLPLVTFQVGLSWKRATKMLT